MRLNFISKWTIAHSELAILHTEDLTIIEYSHHCFQPPTKVLQKALQLNP